MSELDPSDYNSPSGQARHIAQLRSKDMEGEELFDELARLNAQAAQRATLLNQVVRMLDEVNKTSMPVYAGVDLDSQAIQETLEIQAAYYEDYAEALKEQALYYQRRD